MTMKIAIFGCGPAALISAQACFAMGHNPQIYSIQRKSVMPGAQYLHQPIPGITDDEPDGELAVIKIGTKEGYAQRVYGSPDAPVSWDSYEEGGYPAWQLSKTYDKLWARWRDAIVDIEVDYAYMHRIADACDIVFSGIPLNKACSGVHEFHGRRIWVADRAWPGCPDNCIVYNGEDDVTKRPEATWYRTSKIFGHESTEWAVPVMSSWSGIKPLSHNCDCLPENAVPVGRFGRWDKQTLVHHAYQETMDALLAVQ